MDDSSLLAGSSWPAGGDGGAKAEDEELPCTGFVNWGRAIDVTCGLLGALLLVYSASCAADPIADDYADSCPQGYWYVGIVVVAALVFCRPIHVAAKEPPLPAGARPLACTFGRAADVMCGLAGAYGLGYGSSCGVALAVASREEERGLEGICLPAAWWTVPMILAVLLVLRPLWSLASRICPLGSLYRSCHKWRCCCGCSWVFPLLCLCSFACLTYGHFAVNTTVFGITNGIRDENGTDSSFWGGVRDNATNGQWFVLFLAVFFNVVILYVCLVTMVFCWFSPWQRGALVTTVCMVAKWCAFHQYSNVINAISLAFELRYPIVAPDGIWLEAVAGNGVIYQTLGLLFAVSLVEVLLYTYAHSPRTVADGKPDNTIDDDDDSLSRSSWSFGADGSNPRSRLSRRASVAQIGYNYSAAQQEGETARALFLRVSDRKEKERVASGWQAVASGSESFGMSCDCSGKICSVLIQILIPVCLVGFFASFYIAMFAEGTLEFDFVTDVPCQLGLLCPSILPPQTNCAATILRNSGRTVGTDAGNDFTACGDLVQSLADLFIGVWNSEIGYQHDKIQCPNGDDDCPVPGPACYEGECRPGPIILGINRVFGFLLTVGPILVLPQLQMIMAAVIWFIPMKVRSMAHCILAMHMLLAWSTLDVWTVTLAVRMFDLERFSVKAQEELCADFGATLDPPPQVCFGAIGVLGQGYYWLIPACAMQWITAFYVSYEGAGAILQVTDGGDEGPLIPPSRVAADEDDDALPAGGPREALGSADPLPLGADPNWRAASNSSMRYG